MAKVYMGDDACGRMGTVPTKYTPPVDGMDGEDVEVSITGSTNSAKAFMAEDSCEDFVAPEGSSSFGDTDSGTETASVFSDSEVESLMCCEGPPSSMCDDWCESCQGREKPVTKKVTMHWKKFIRPISWRCKWLELKLKQLQSLASKYEKELQTYNHTKEFDFAHLTLDDTNVKSVPISGRMHKNKVMKRNKRNRVEDKCDIESYMSNHSLFSYNGKTDFASDARPKDVEDAGTGGHNGINVDEFMFNDAHSSRYYDYLDKSFDDMMQKIEALQLQVQSLKTKTNTVMRENTSMTQSRMSEQSNGGNALGSHEGIIGRTATINKPELDDPWENAKDAVQTKNHQELHAFENFGNRPVDRTKESVEIQVPKPNSIENVVRNENSSLKSCSTLRPNIPVNKRKKREKSGSRR